MGVIRVKRSGSWAPARGLYVKQSGAWTPAEKAYIKQNGAWEQIYPAPAAMLSLSSATLSLTAYQGYSSTSQRITITNSGNDTMTIKSISATSNSFYRVLFDTSAMGGTSGVTIAPSASKYFDVTIFGLSVTAGTTTPISIQYNTGVLGDDEGIVTVTGQVDPQYSTISVSPTSVSYSTYVDGPLPSQNITITNSGNGGVLTVSGITSASGLTSITNVPSLIASGSSSTFRITAPAGRSAGTHGDTIYVNTNLGTTNIPVSFSVISTGTIEFSTPGTYSWTVPTGVTSATVTVVGAGGGGGGSTEVGYGGGGGGGGSGGLIEQSLALTAGETLSITVGAGGPGGPFIGRTTRPPAGSTGTSSSITALVGTLTATGGSGGAGAVSQGDYSPTDAGGGGAGGSPNGYPGLSGVPGTNDRSSVNGGAGALNFVSGSTQGAAGTTSSPTGKNGTRGSGGGGAGTTDRVSPYSWAGGSGGNGYVKLSW